MVEDDDSGFAALQAGARGYLLKGARKADLVRAVRGAAEAEAIFGPAIAQRLLRYFAAPPPPTPAYAFPELTAREAHVLQLMAERQSWMFSRRGWPAGALTPLARNEVSG